MDKKGYFYDSQNGLQLPAIPGWADLTDSLIIFVRLDRPAGVGDQSYIDASIISLLDDYEPAGKKCYVLNYFISTYIGAVEDFYGTDVWTNYILPRIDGSKDKEKFENYDHYTNWLGTHPAPAQVEDKTGFLKYFSDTEATETVDEVEDIYFIAFVTDTSGKIESIELNDRGMHNIPVIECGAVLLSDGEALLGSLEDNFEHSVVDFDSDNIISPGNGAAYNLHFSEPGQIEFTDYADALNGMDNGVTMLEANYTDSAGHPAYTEEEFYIVKLELLFPPSGYLYPDTPIALSGALPGWITVLTDDDPVDPDNVLEIVAYADDSVMDNYLTADPAGQDIDLLFEINIPFLYFSSSSIALRYEYMPMPALVFDIPDNDEDVVWTTAVGMDSNTNPLIDQSNVKIWINNNDENAMPLTEVGTFGDFGDDFFNIDGGTEFTVNLAYFEDETDTASTATVSRGFRIAPPDFYMKDNDTDTGAVPSVGRMWKSPDIAVHEDPVPAGTDPFAESGQGSKVESGQDNYIYLRLRNRGGHHSGVLTAKVYYSIPTSLMLPEEWNYIDVVSNIVFPKNEDTLVLPAIRWPANQIPTGGHYCFVCEIDHIADPAPPQSTVTNAANFSSYISENNNLAWRNFNVVDLKSAVSNKTIKLEFKMSAFSKGFEAFDFEIRKTKGDFNMDIGLRANKSVLQQLSPGLPPWLVQKKTVRSAMISPAVGKLSALPGKGGLMQPGAAGGYPVNLNKLFKPGQKVLRFTGIRMKKGWDGPASFILANCKGVKNGDTIEFRQFYRKKEVGRITWRFRV